MRSAKAGVIFFLAATICSAVVVHQTIYYKAPIKRISGRVVGFGTVNPGLTVRVLDKPEVWSDNSLSFNEKRKRQSTVASTTIGSNGKFDFRAIPKGSYEVEFAGKQGWNPLSVFITVAPDGTSKQLCVELSIDGFGEGPSAQPCP